jgi:hypothetical protein
MPYRGRVKNGVIVLDDAVELPEGTPVNVEPTEAKAIPTLAEQLQDVIGIVTDMPSDMAENHDHYIHGTPKR